MRKILPVLLLCLVSFSVFSQTCEEREKKLLGGLGSFSAAMVYNTYLAIGSISDNYVNKGYDEAKVNALLEEQKNLLDRLVKVLEDLKKDKTLDADDSAYTDNLASILKGLKKQSQQALDYVKDKKDTTAIAYDITRKKNWKEISLLLGLGDPADDED